MVKGLSCLLGYRVSAIPPLHRFESQTEKFKENLNRSILALVSHLPTGPILELNSWFIHVTSYTRRAALWVVLEPRSGQLLSTRQAPGRFDRSNHIFIFWKHLWVCIWVWRKIPLFRYFPRFCLLFYFIFILVFWAATK